MRRTPLSFRCHVSVRIPPDFTIYIDPFIKTEMGKFGKNVAIAGGGQTGEAATQVVELSTLTLELEGNVVPGKLTTTVAMDFGRAELGLAAALALLGLVPFAGRGSRMGVQRG